MRYAASRGVAVVIMEPLLGGKLANPPRKVRQLMEAHPVARSPVEWALDWLWDQPETAVLLSGMSNIEQTRENLRYAERSSADMLTDADRELIARIQAVFKSYENIPCTKCAYCMPCPSGVDIPGNFDAYNMGFLFDDIEVGRNEYSRMRMFGEPSSMASACVGCRSCEPKCPQRIEISELMPRIDKALNV
jgi:predicted aldo/keto reductase-like oxidoreductase